MPKFKVTLEHRQTMMASVDIIVEAEDKEAAEAIVEGAWGDYNDGRTGDMMMLIMPDGSEWEPPDPEEIVDGESSVSATLIEED